MNKQELASKLQERLVDPEYVEASLVLTNHEEWKLFERLLGRVSMQLNSKKPSEYLFLMSNGLLFPFYDQGKMFYVVPEEIQEAYNKVQSEAFLYKRERYEAVLQYCLAAVNLYGYVEIKRLFELYIEQNQDPLNEEEFKGIIFFHLARPQSFWMEQGYLISDYFRDFDDLKELMDSTLFKPYYTPDRETFLKYAESDYFEMTPQLNKLKKFILKNLSRDRELVEDLIDDIQLACSMEEPLQSIIHEFERRNIIFDDMEQVNILISLITDVHNHTRLWSNRGHTPVELSLSRKPETQGMGVSYSQAKSVKIGRNEPCPCGSGKKYKKCCMN
ncbi:MULTISPECIES: YecA family protein [Paenibacillus]|uniref:YecA family protein n=1 Tax=Paenibacillus residui TaxID=629724 RepID=A0ABW3DAQ1_9BACL|nr:SEC-C metal-binding domain-containing protein [Paenibacillus sp. 32O-W]